MRVISVNVGLPREIPWRGEMVSTGIFKNAVAGPIPIRGFNFEGDAQADLTLHGGRDKSIYAYAAEHYDSWKQELPGRDLPNGVFGENLTTEGLLENEVCIGDGYRVGTALLTVTQPRMPCFKLGIRFNNPGMVKRFTVARRPGIYFAILEEGEVAAGDTIELVRRDPAGLTVSEFLDIILDKKPSPERIRRALAVPGIAQVWREEFTQWLGQES